jgi:uncharacterized protein YjcR
MGGGAMPKRRPERDKAQEIFLETKGKISPKQIGERLGISPAQIRKWKSIDKWDALLKKRKRGGQPGNKNAAGNSGGAPKGNINAQTHGAYSFPRTANWSEDERKVLESLEIAFDPLADSELKRLLAKQHDLERRISELDGDDTDDTLYLYRMMTMEMPNGAEMKYRSESSKFARRMLYEQELNKVQGRIQKLLDSIRAREDANKRMEFEREKFSFAKQKAMGEFEVDDSGEISQEKEDEEILEIIE